MLNYQHNGNTYAPWVQNVAEFDTQDKGVYIEDSIWNSSAFDANITGVQGNGGIGYAIIDGQTVAYYCYTDSASYTTLNSPSMILSPHKCNNKQLGSTSDPLLV